MDLATYLAILRRRAVVIGVPALVSTLTVALVGLSTSPTYRAITLLRVTTTARSLLDSYQQQRAHHVRPQTPHRTTRNIT